MKYLFATKDSGNNTIRKDTSEVLQLITTTGEYRDTQLRELRN